MQTLVMNIKREFFAAILAVPRRKSFEYRDMSDYWMTRLAKVGPAPFNLRLLNGMLRPVPVATVRVEKVTFDKKNQVIQFHLGRVLQVKNWDRRVEQPACKEGKPLIYDMWQQTTFLGTVEQQGENLLFRGPEAAYLQRLVTGLHKPAAETMKLLPQMFRGQALYVRSHGSSPWLYDDGKPQVPDAEDTE